MTKSSSCSNAVCDVGYISDPGHAHYGQSYCYNPYDKNFKETAYNFPLHVIRQIYKDLGPDIYSNVMCETDEEIWLIEKDDRLNAFFWQEDMDITCGDLDKTLNKDPWTMIIQLRDRNHDQEVINAVTKHEGFAIRFWYTYPYAEVYHLKTSKAACIYDIAEYYDIPISNCIEIGDADNDIEMLTKVGFGIAMKNGNENVKKLAHLISKKDNNHSGVKQAIKVAMKFLNNKL